MRSVDETELGSIYEGNVYNESVGDSTMVRDLKTALSTITMASNAFHDFLESQDKGDVADVWLRLTGDSQELVYNMLSMIDDHSK